VAFLITLQICNVYGISSARSICSTLFGRWQHRCGLSLSVLQQLVVNNRLRDGGRSNQTDCVQCLTAGLLCVSVEC